MANVENLESHVSELQAKVDELKSEMSAAISEIVSIKSQSIVKAILDQFGIVGKEAKLTWEFYPESDDQGGTVWYPEDLQLFVDGENIDMDNHVVKRKSKYSDNFYEESLDEVIREDFIYDLKEELHSQGVEQLVIDITGEEN